MYTLGINAAYHDSSACLVRDGRVIAAAEEERFTWIKHGKRPLPFSTYELPFHAIEYCFLHSSDEYKVVALASFGKPTYVEDFRSAIHIGGDGQYTIGPLNFVERFGPCVMNARLRGRGPFRRIWVQPAAGDAGTALGAALWIDARERAGGEQHEQGQVQAAMPGLPLEVGGEEAEPAGGGNEVDQQPSTTRRHSRTAASSIGRAQSAPWRAARPT